METIEVIFICHYNFETTCVQFYHYVKEENNMIKKVKSTLMYDWDKND